MRVLEIGCGTGLFTEMFAQSGATLVAVDISEELLDKAHLRGLPADQVTFLNKRFEECDVDGPFDAVVGSSILHHLEMEAALSKIYDLLKPGGLMSFAEPNMLNPQVFLERKLRFLFSYVSPDETAFTSGGLKTLLRDAGFTAMEVTPHGWLHPAVPGAFVGVMEKMEALLEMTPGVREFAASLLICAQRPEQ
jgi:cyclopropane fatty-acyl-phospholipid synthase-like methyltransferase